MYRILVVDDESGIRDIIRQYVMFEGFSYDEASDGLQAIECCQSNKYDLIIMDVMMPNCDGITALRTIRKTQNTPVILLTAKGEEYDKILGFELGADDYVVKPFSPKELVSRIKAILKRTATPDNNPEKQLYVFKDLVLNPHSYELKIDGKRIAVTPKEFEMMLYFTQHQNIALTRDALLNHIWGYDFYGDTRTVDTHIKMLRSNLGAYRNLIQTIWGVGYKYAEY